MRKIILLVSLILLLSSSLTAGPYGPSGRTALTALPEASIDSPVEVTVEQSDDVSTILRFEVGAYQQTPYEISGETFYGIALPNEAIQLTKGAPMLPSIRRSIIIPDMAATILQHCLPKLMSFLKSCFWPVRLSYQTGEPKNMVPVRIRCLEFSENLKKNNVIRVLNHMMT